MLLWFELLPSFLATCNGFYTLLFVTFTKECKVESLSTFHVSAFIYVGVFDNVWISIGGRHFPHCSKAQPRLPLNGKDRWGTWASILL